MTKYCEDIPCPNFGTDIDAETDCKLGFNNPLVLPKSIADTYTHNWGYRMPLVCRRKYKLSRIPLPNKQEKGEDNG